jgi:hypothetical protein
MAYERTWNFAPVLGPRIPAAASDDIGYKFWAIKSLLKGEWGGATQGLWTVVGSCDGSSGAMDGTDRWGTTFNAAKIPSGSTAATATGWMILRSPAQPNGVYIDLLLASNQISQGPTYAVVAVSISAFALNGLLVPTGGTLICGSLSSFVVVPNADTTTQRRYYGALTSTGDFWFVQTMAGKAETFLAVINPVGTKSQDQVPVYATRGYSSANDATTGAAGGCALFTPSATKMFNGAAGYVCLVQPPALSLLDACDTSLFDFPAWVIVGNNATLTSSTQIHARGRLPDIGLCAGVTATASAPVVTGNVIRDVSNNIKYVTCGQLILPYNIAIT